MAITGFMGVGKSSVARHLSQLLGCSRLDLDREIEHREGRRINEIIDSRGIEQFRRLETAVLDDVLRHSAAPIISLGGGTWTVPENRDLIAAAGVLTIWLESSFEHCWYNIRDSATDRPLARDKEKAKRLFDERRAVYGLADWHLVVRPSFTSLDVARQIADAYL